ncbi:MAG: very short patch repair endonuclease [Dissulfurispiraceae bacterium]
MDTLSTEKRSWNMSRIRSRNTKPERIVRSILHGLGYRFRLHVKSLPGTPDLVLPKYKTVIFVHGCFWHRHPGCKLAYTPKSRIEFWMKKFECNIASHENAVQQLSSLGWQVMVIWECELSDPDALRERLCGLFGKSIPRET